MKVIYHGIAVFLSALLLSACVGGGSSGGGSSGGGAPDGTIGNADLAGGSPTTRKASSLEDVFGQQLAAALQTPAQINSAAVSAQAGDLIILGSGATSEAMGAVDIAALAPAIFRISPSELALHDNGLITWKNPSPDVESVSYIAGVGPASGTAVYGNSAVLGGKSTAIIGGLEYAEFGIWHDVIDVDVTAGGQTAKGAIYNMSPLAFGITDKKTSPGAAGGTFTGTALAAAFQETGYTADMVSLVGTANLTVNSAAAGTLALRFPQNYVLSGNASIDGNGAINGMFSSLSTDPNAHIQLGDTLVGFSSNSFTGQFYGAVPTAASEAVGGFKLVQGTQQSGEAKGIIGTYGVKR